MADDPFDELRRGLRGDATIAEDTRRIDVRHLVIGVGVAAVLGVAVVVSQAARRPATPAQATAPSPTIAVIDGPLAPMTAPSVARVWPAEPVDVDGNEVRSGAHRWTVGAPGDLIAVGDWDCDGTATPGVLRPTSGRLHLFEGWATPETTITASPGPSVPPNATAVESTGCGHAVVRTADGRTVELETASAP